MIDLLSALQEIMRHGRDDRPPVCDEAVARVTASVLEHAGHNPAELGAAIRYALLDAAERLDRVSFAVTGLAWLGAGVPSVEQEMLSLVKCAQREIGLCAYSITASAMVLLEEILEGAVQGLNATIVVNALAQQPVKVQAFLRNGICRASGRWRVLDFTPAAGQTDLHAKILVVDRSTALVGSANLSFRGMVTNHEMAVIIRGPAAEEVAARLDMLARSALVRSFS